MLIVNSRQMFWLIPKHKAFGSGAFHIIEIRDCSINSSRYLGLFLHRYFLVAPSHIDFSPPMVSAMHHSQTTWESSSSPYNNLHSVCSFFPLCYGTSCSCISPHISIFISCSSTTLCLWSAIQSIQIHVVSQPHVVQVVYLTKTKPNHLFHPSISTNKESPPLINLII